jgi:hypothetical protein
VFLDALARELPFLREWGYDEPTVELLDGLLPSLHARFLSSQRQLVLALVVDDSRLPEAPSRHLITGHLYRNAGAEQDDRLNVEWFATLHRLDLAEQLDHAADQGGTLADFVRTVVPIYGTLFRDDMRSLLEGTAWESGTGDPNIYRQFEFLQRDFGFSPPKGRWCGHDLTHTYTRGNVSVNVAWDGGPHEVMSITVDDLPTQFIWQTPPEQVIVVLKKHPEIFDGDFRALAGMVVAN